MWKEVTKGTEYGESMALRLRIVMVHARSLRPKGPRDDAFLRKAPTARLALKREQGRRRASLASTGEGACAYVVFAGGGARDTKRSNENTKGSSGLRRCSPRLVPSPRYFAELTWPLPPGVRMHREARSAKSRKQRRSRRNHGRFVAILKLTNQVQGVPQSATISKPKRRGEEK
jgi:hypothetical protein